MSGFFLASSLYLIKGCHTGGQNFTHVFMPYFVTFTEKEPCTKFCGVLISFHEVMKLLSFKFEASDVKTANGHAQHANCGLNVTFWISWSLIFCFMMKKYHFELKLLLWPRVPFNPFIVSSRSSSTTFESKIVPPAPFFFLPPLKFQNLVPPFLWFALLVYNIQAFPHPNF